MESYITRFREIEIMAGDSNIELQFQLFYEDGTPIDLRSSRTMWYLAPIGQKHNSILEKEGEILKDIDPKTGRIISAYRFRVILNSEDTINLYGKYVHQPVLIDRHSEPDQTFRRAEGFINFRPQIRKII